MRGKQATPRKIKPDEIYNSVLVTKIINTVMQDGKKRIATNIVYNAIAELNTKTKSQGTEALERAIENVKPKIEVRSRRVGGSNFQIPVPVSSTRQVSLAVRWLITSARAARKNTEFYVTFSRELLSAYNKEGNAFKKKEDVYKMAEANKAFAQFA